MPVKNVSKWWNKTGLTTYLLLMCCSIAVLLQATVWNRCQNRDEDVQSLSIDFRRSLAATLLDITAEVKGYDRKIYPRTLLKLNSIIELLDPRYMYSILPNLTLSPSEKESIMKEKDAADMCGEIYSNPIIQFPFFHSNTSPTCKNGTKKKQIYELLTIVINAIDLDSKMSSWRLNTLLKSIRNYNNNLQVIAAIGGKTEEISELEAKYEYITLVDKFDRGSTNTANVWNTVVKLAKTPYVLVARDLDYFDTFARLERQIYSISALESVGVAGGAFRNITGHWRVGCFQSEIKNYKLRYTEGYKYSAHGCMFCDHLEGPFVANAKLMKHVPFNEKMPRDAVFIDWFLKLRHSNVLVMSCPDAMYFTRGNNSLYEWGHRDMWKSVAKDWELNSVALLPTFQIQFTCKELEVPCRYAKWDSYFLLPPCCLAQLGNAWKALDDFSRKHNVDYELQFGSILGAVKLRGQLPWDPDADCFYDAKHNNTFRQMQGYQDVIAKQFDSSDNDGPKFRIFTPDFYIEMWGRHTFTTQFLPPMFRKTPTLMSVFGIWLRGVANPGLYARNSYGFDYLKHALHPLSGGFNDTLKMYRTGEWNPCPSKNYHSCLDQYPTDGSIDFTIV